MNTILIIDGNGLIHRAFHALPDFMNSGEQPTNAVYGFASVLYKVIADTHPTHVLICFDTVAPTFRDVLFKEYRTQRPETDRNLISQFPLIKQFVDATGIKRVEIDGFEADDLIATFCSQAHERGFKSIILTGDKDLFQMVNHSTFILTPSIGHVKNGILYDEEQVIKRFGIPPSQVADFKALVGDPSDNYKGVPGIGPKSAVDLLKKFETVEHIYENLEKIENPSLREKLRKGKEDAVMAKKLAVLDTKVNVPYTIDDLAFTNFSRELEGFFDTIGFKTLKRRYFPDKTEQVSLKPVKVEPKKKDQLGLF